VERVSRIRVSSPRGNVFTGKKKSKFKVKNSPVFPSAKVLVLINHYNF